ncbi:MAG: GTPase ObgE [Patescibacteria group bacterium]
MYDEPMLVDDVKIKVKAGNGGNGAVAFNKNMKSLGPSGTHGGNGGNVYVEGVSDLSALNQYRFKKEQNAENGKDGRSQFRDGQTGKDLVLPVPVGTIVHNLSNGFDEEVTKIGEKILVAKGGRGGKGNFHFRSSINTSPKEFNYGTPGESFEIRLELKLIADVGLIGLPNAGKSSLLNALTNAKSRVANYQFTTLEPHLGVYYELILADIPGLIEGASSGKGLGTKFLRHIERTKVLFHLISSESLDIPRDYKIIKNELASFSKTLAEKKEYVFLTKSDLIDEKELKEKIKELKKIKVSPIPISIIDEDKIEEVKKILNKIQEKK